MRGPQMFYSDRRLGMKAGSINYNPQSETRYYRQHGHRMALCRTLM
ncbi:hypothetical protein PROSTU_00171 [Providencia stuartii ATCC 25827]|uniref:Uncharacterized protein n=1 Tax=Providencia stuartii ATCC 25827 TaxID=471874 RepID=A0AA87CV17_PROST|nr:hypothetical protein PROSTU_00171 [Providencia stuartii ATCC 25827]